MDNELAAKLVMNLDRIADSLERFYDLMEGAIRVESSTKLTEEGNRKRFVSVSAECTNFEG